MYMSWVIKLHGPYKISLSSRVLSKIYYELCPKMIGVYYECYSGYVTLVGCVACLLNIEA
jgi:hypothetical protein